MKLVKTLKTKARWSVRTEDGIPVLGYQPRRPRMGTSPISVIHPQGVNFIWDLNFVFTFVVKGRSSVSYMIQSVNPPYNEFHMTSSGALTILQNVGRNGVRSSVGAVSLPKYMYDEQGMPTCCIQTEEHSVFEAYLTVVKQGTECSLAPMMDLSLLDDANISIRP